MKWSDQKKENEWTIRNEDGTTTSDHQEVADIFNNFFIKKVKDLKSNIDKDYIMDPLDKLNSQKKTEKTFGIKPVSQKQLLKFMSKMKKKQSAGTNGLSQDKLVLGSKSLVYPLLQIINQSIREGAFPSQWKEALVTPVLKKGDASEKENNITYS